MNNQTKFRLLSIIALDVYIDWKNISPHALPYLQAMRKLDTIDDKFGIEYGSEIVTRFLGNAGTWRGTKAKEIKLELQTILKR
jgi:hypothetical protein